MKRQTIIGILLLGTLVLSSCGSKEDPITAIKNLQVNSLETIKMISFDKASKGTINLNANIFTPAGEGKINLSIDGKGQGLLGESNIKLNADFDVKAPKVAQGTLKGNIDMVSTKNKMYGKINSFDLNISSQDNQVNEGIKNIKTVINNLKGKWIYQEVNRELNDIKQNLKVIDKYNLKEELEKYSTLKVNKVLGDHKYEVSLDKKNIATIIYNIAKKRNKNTSLTVERMKKNINGDIEGVITLSNNDREFIFSGYIIPTKEYKTPIKVEYKSGKIIVKSNFNQNNIKVDGSVSIEYKNIDKVNIKIPENAVSIEQAMGMK